MDVPPKVAATVPTCGDTTSPPHTFAFFVRRLFEVGREKSWSHSNYMGVLATNLKGELHELFMDLKDDKWTFTEIILELNRIFAMPRTVFDKQKRLLAFKRHAGESLRTVMGRLSHALARVKELWSPKTRETRFYNEMIKAMYAFASPAAQLAMSNYTGQLTIDANYSEYENLYEIADSTEDLQSYIHPHDTPLNYQMTSDEKRYHAEIKQQLSQLSRLAPGSRQHEEDLQFAGVESVSGSSSVEEELQAAHIPIQRPRTFKSPQDGARGGVQKPYNPPAKAVIAPDGQAIQRIKNKNKPRQGYKGVPSNNQPKSGMDVDPPQTAAPHRPQGGQPQGGQQPGGQPRGNQTSGNPQADPNSATTRKQFADLASKSAAAAAEQAIAMYKKSLEDAKPPRYNPPRQTNPPKQTNPPPQTSGYSHPKYNPTPEHDPQFFFPPAAKYVRPPPITAPTPPPQGYKGNPPRQSGQQNQGQQRTPGNQYNPPRAGPNITGQYQPAAPSYNNIYMGQQGGAQVEIPVVTNFIPEGACKHCGGIRDHQPFFCHKNPRVEALQVQQARQAELAHRAANPGNYSRNKAKNRQRGPRGNQRGNQQIQIQEDADTRHTEVDNSMLQVQHPHASLFGPYTPDMENNTLQLEEEEDDFSSLSSRDITDKDEFAAHFAGSSSILLLRATHEYTLAPGRQVSIVTPPFGTNTHHLTVQQGSQRSCVVQGAMNHSTGVLATTLTNPTSVPLTLTKGSILAKCQFLHKRDESMPARPKVNQFQVDLPKTQGLGNFSYGDPRGQHPELQALNC